VTLADLLRRVEQGERVPTDPWLSVMPAPAPDTAAVVAFPGHVVVAADVDPAWVRSQLPHDDLSAPLNPPFLHACEQKLGRRVNNIDGLYLAAPLDGSPPVPLREVSTLDHPRVRRARRYRPLVRVWTTDGGVLVIGRGLADRWEAAIEVDVAYRGRGLGRALARAARHLVPPIPSPTPPPAPRAHIPAPDKPPERRPIWAQVAPGNAASVRAFLAAGFRPVGAEALLVR
jgi:GNAT superfamily N-acetyltransferase